MNSNELEEMFGNYLIGVAVLCALALVVWLVMEVFARCAT